MQIKGLHKNIYKLSSYTLSQEKLETHRKKYEKPVNLWKKLKSKGVSSQICQEATGISRATYYRYKAQLVELEKGILPPSKRPKSLRKPQWGESELQLVLYIRRENPTYGKAKIAVILQRDHNAQFSESTVGRILKHLMNKGLIQRSLSALRQRKARRFTGHAQKWKYGMKALNPGQMVQIDHMTVSKNNICGKHFQAWDPKSKLTQDRWLDEEELDRLWEVLNPYPSHRTAYIFKLLLLTGARKGEALNATWDQFNLEKGIWTKPSHLTKQKKKEHLPLSEKALELLQNLQKLDNQDSPYLFPGRITGEPIKETKTFWNKVLKEAHLENVRIHDLRHTHAGHLASNNIGLHIVGKLLGYTQASTTLRYAHLANAPLRQAANLFGNKVGKLTTRITVNSVVP